jgi:hypothetical protein
MRHFHLTPMLAILLLVGCGGGGGSTKPDPEPTVACSQRLGTGSFVTSTVNNPAVSDSTCPTGSTLTTAGSSYTTTTTTYSCPNPNSNTNPVAATDCDPDQSVHGDAGIDLRPEGRSGCIR